MRIRDLIGGVSYVFSYFVSIYCAVQSFSVRANLLTDRYNSGVLHPALVLCSSPFYGMGTTSGQPSISAFRKATVGKITTIHISSSCPLIHACEFLPPLPSLQNLNKKKELSLIVKFQTSLVVCRPPIHLRRNLPRNHLWSQPATPLVGFHRHVSHRVGVHISQRDSLRRCQSTNRHELPLRSHRRQSVPRTTACVVDEYDLCETDFGAESQLDFGL